MSHDNSIREWQHELNSDPKTPASFRSESTNFVSCPGCNGSFSVDIQTTPGIFRAIPKEEIPPTVERLENQKPLDFQNRYPVDNFASVPPNCTRFCNCLPTLRSSGYDGNVDGFSNDFLHQNCNLFKSSYGTPIQYNYLPSNFKLEPISQTMVQRLKQKLKLSNPII